MKKALFVLFIFVAMSLPSCRSNDPLPAYRPFTGDTTGTTTGVNTTTGTTTGNNTLPGTTIYPDEATSLVSYTYTNLPAAVGGVAQSTEGHYTLFSLRNNSIIALSDSATDKWDIGFKSTTIIFNSVTSGPGNAGVILQMGLYDDIAEAPATGYKQDNAKVLPPYAIPTGSANGWYNYNDLTHVVSPVPGRLLLIRTANNKYAKMQILSYYKDAPANPTLDSESRYYTFKYTFQGDGSRNLKQ